VTGELEELRGALRAAHESLRWLARIRTHVGTVDASGANVLCRLVELWAVAECCAELHAALEPVTVDDVLELAGWDGDGPGRQAVECALATLE
jgi:hypothetical protein